MGGTAIALHIGHRYSLDFDLFTDRKIVKKNIHEKLSQFQQFKKKIIWESGDQMHFNIHQTKLTFYQYPFKMKADVQFESIVKLPSLIDLAAMKSLALGGRAKWKDYVDIYFLLKYHFTFEQIAHRASEIFKEGAFNPKLLKEQLSFFDDISYEEEVNFLPGFEVSEEEVKSFLVNIAIEPF